MCVYILSIPFKATTLVHYDHRMRILDYVVSWGYWNSQCGDQGQQLDVRQPFAEAHFLLTEAQAPMLELDRTLGIILVNSNFTSSEADSMRAFRSVFQMLAQRQCQETFACPGKILTHKNSLFPPHQQGCYRGAGWKSSVSVSCQVLPQARMRTPVLCSLHYNMQLPFIYLTIKNAHPFPLSSWGAPSVT